ncbi:glutathione S-transferase family protein [Salinisphaera sp. T31B1]|uniref:glutathione S-transferase family protein n=1 Tax=Salinisphaera sp. T31B1 TaxID=727963 RepID=UPI0033414F8C
MTMRIHGDLMSGNCLKVKWVADHLRLPYDWVPVDILTGETRSAAFRAINPFGQVPVVEFADGHTLTQSNAIICHLARGSVLVPAEAFERARMLEWLFWEQYSHEPAIAVRRFEKHFMHKADDEIEPRLFERGHLALAHMNTTLTYRDWLAGGDWITLADIALLAYTRLAHEGGFDLAAYNAIRHWIARCEPLLGLAPIADTRQVPGE